MKSSPFCLVCFGFIVRGAFNKIPDFFFVPAFNIVVHSWKFTVLLLYILWDDRPIFMISGSNQQLQQQLEYTLLNSDCHSWWISKMQYGREDTSEERYAIKLCFKSWLVKGLGLGLLCWGFKGVQEEIPREEASNFQIGSVAFPPWQYTSPQLHPLHRLFDQDGNQDRSSASLQSRPSSCDFWLFPNLTGCRYKTIGEMKEAVTKVIYTLTQEDFHGASQKLLERYNKCIAAGGITSKGIEFQVCTINKSAHTKSLETYLIILVYQILLVI